MDFHFEGISALIIIFAILAIPVLVITFLVANFAKFTHRKKKLVNNVIKAEYRAPHNLSAAEIGYLFDSRLSKEELVATVFELEQLGYIALNKDGSSIKFSILDYGSTAQLKPHQIFIFDCIRSENRLNQLIFKSQLGFNKELNLYLYEQGYIHTRLEVIKHLAKRFFIYYLLIILVLPFLLGGFASLSNYFGMLLIFIILGIFLFPFFAALALVGVFAYGKIVGYPNLWSNKLKKIWPEIEGFREFIKQVELDNLQFDSKTLKEQSINDTLPFAIALGLNTNWQERFK